MEPIFSVDIDLDSLLVNHTVHAHVAQKKINVPFPVKRPYIVDTKIRVNGNLVVGPDIVGLNGAIHVINKLLNPRDHHHGHNRRTNYSKDCSGSNDWEDWETWLIDWAAEDNVIASTTVGN